MEATVIGQPTTAPKGNTPQPNGQCIKEPKGYLSSFRPDIEHRPINWEISSRSQDSREHLKSEGQQNHGSRSLSLA